MTANRKRLGDLLIEAGLLTQKDMDLALGLQKKTGMKLGEILINEGIIDEYKIIEVLEYQLGIPHIDLKKYHIEPNAPGLISENLAKLYNLIPVKSEENLLYIAMADPMNIVAIDDVSLATGMEIQPLIATNKDVKRAIEFFYGKESTELAIEDIHKEYESVVDTLDEEQLNEINNAPLVRLVNSIIKQAIVAKASDIHIEPFEFHVRVRFRIDGELQEVVSPSKSTHSAIVTRIKIMGKMNIAEKRVPQDGRVETFMEGRAVDLRISVLPTVYGEKVVIRILDRGSFSFNKKELGFSDSNLAAFDKIIKSPNGIILTTGPTGSGKTTTLYVVLKELNNIDKNIITVEDPVEYRLDGVNQVQVNTKAGLTFANGLRSILRQDPDIIMIGEIRDAETAQIAVRASITGHLVLSTMHTNDTASTVSRLTDMGIEPYLVSSSVVGIIAQRLVRKVCQDCAKDYTPTEAEKGLVGIVESLTTKKGTGCNVCNYTGYKGRTAIHEIMPVNRQIRQMINELRSVDDIRAVAKEEGMITLRDSCLKLVKDGITTIDELIKITYSIE